MRSSDRAVLRTRRLELRSPDEADVDAIAALCQDAEVQRWTTIPSPYAREDAAGFVSGLVANGWSNGTGCTWGIRVDGGARLVGMVGLDGIRNRQAELGYWLCADTRGQGLMSEAVAAVLDFGFSELGVERVVWYALTGNHPSAAVARAAGFRFEGTARLGGLQRGARRDTWQAGLLADDPRDAATGWPAETFAAGSLTAGTLTAATRAADSSADESFTAERR